MIEELQEEIKPDLRLSYSRVSSFVKNGPKELNDETRTIIENDGISFGKLVDLIEQNVDISEEFYIFDGEKPTAMLGTLCDIIINTVENPLKLSTNDIITICRDNNLWNNIKKEDTLISRFDNDDFWSYIKAQINSKDKTIVTTYEYLLAKEKVDILRTHEFTKHIFNNKEDHIEIIDQYKLEFTYKKFNFLGYIDKLIINHKDKNIRLIDLKTGQDSPYRFNTTIFKWGYYLQECIYMIGAYIVFKDYIKKGYKILPFQFVYISRDNNTPLIYEVSKENSKLFLNGFKRNGYEYKGIDVILDDIYWHWYNKEYILPRTIIESNGVVQLRNDIESL